MKNIFLTFLVLFGFFASGFAQKRISGLVTEEDGSPLPGVSIVVKNTTIGTITNVDGSYAFDVPPTAKSIVFSFIGMKKHEVEIAGKTTINVVMESESKLLDEVVAIGYGTQKKVNLTGAVANVKVSDAEGRAITSASQLLQGKVSGISIVQKSGRPGGDGSTIRIRGISSIDNNNEPLVIIDGIEGAFDDVHPSDIESISVLKDAASASIYGSRASAGVIIIETKSGIKGELKVDYTGSISTQKATQLPNVVNSWEHAALRNEAKRNMGVDPFYTDDQIELYKYGIDPSYPNTNWIDEFFKTSVMQNHFVSAKGGGDRYQFSSSVGYINQNGILIGTSSEKVTYRNKIDADFLNKKIKVGFMFSGYSQDIKELPSGTTSAIRQAAEASPVFWASSIPDDEGNVMYSYSGRELGLHALGGGQDNAENMLQTQYYIQITPLKDLIGKLTYSKNLYARDYVRFVPEFYTGDLEGNPAARYESFLEKRWAKTENNTLQGTLNYTKNIKRHSFSVLLGYERFERIHRSDEGRVTDLSTNEPIFDFGNPTSHYLTSSANESATASYFSRVNYSFADKYLLEFNIRRDGSSRFAEFNRWSTFPSVSAGWRLSEEGFMESLEFVDQLKLRASWGKLGNQNIGTYYAASDRMSGSQYYAFGHVIVPGRGTTLLANPDTKWETTEQYNVGLDANLFNKFDFTFDYFYKTTYDILAQITIPPSLGVSATPYQNVGEMLNKGVEMSLGYQTKLKEDRVNLSVNANVGFLKNEVTDLGVLKFVNHSNVLRSQLGGPFSSFYGYISDGIYQVNDFTWQNESDIEIPHYQRQYVLKENLPDPSGIMNNPMPGDLKFRDIVSLEGEDKAMITPDDKTIMGKSVPSMNYGFNINVSYKKFALNIIGQGVSGIESYQSGKLVQPFHNAGSGSVLREHADRRWTFENPSTKYMRLVEDKGRDALLSSYYVFDASYFRLKNVELSYSVPKKVLKNLYVDRCRIFLSGENLLLITKYLEGFDPERPSTTTSTGFHPQIVTYTMGFNLSF